MATSYWDAISPRTGEERQTVRSNCGRKCFLMPAQMKFPICRSCGRSHCSCAPDCSALKAAVIRSGQWGYQGVHRRARKMFDDLGCAWTAASSKNKKKTKTKTMKSGSFEQSSRSLARRASARKSGCACKGRPGMKRVID